MTTKTKTARPRATATAAVHIGAGIERDALIAERDALRAQVAQEQAQVQTAAAQQQALRGRATGPTRRSPMTTPVEADPVQEHAGKSVAATAAAFARMM